MAEFLEIEDGEPFGEEGRYRSYLDIQPEHLAPNGFLHATVVVGLADTCCAGGASETMPEGARFSTLEIKTNLLSTAREGRLRCEAVLRHDGRTTQVWDAEVRVEATGKLLALFRCTQLIMRPAVDS